MLKSFCVGDFGSRMVLHGSEMAEVGKKMFERIEQLSASFSAAQISADTSTFYSPEVKQEDILNPSFENVEKKSARKPGVIPKMWTPDEDLILRTAVEKHGEKNWREIAEEVPERNHLQCLQRWKKALKPGLVKGHWRKDEDNYLLLLMKDYEPGTWNWAKISLKIPGRNAKQCRERWFLNLDPSINRGPWSQKEDDKLLELHKAFKGRWSLIAKELEGRTENSVKTRFHSLQRREVRERGWIQDEDDVFVRGLLVYGRNYVLCARLLPGRSRGQLKKRFPTLCQMRPELAEQVRQVEARIASGHKPTPIHKMLQALQDERKRKRELEEEVERQAANAQAQQQQQQMGNQNSYLFEPRQTTDYDEGLVLLEETASYGNFKRDHVMKKLQNSWMDELLEEITDQAEPMSNGGILRQNSANVMADIINVEEQGTVYRGQNESYAEPVKREERRKKVLTKKQSSLLLLDKLLNNMDEFGDVLTAGEQLQSQNVNSNYDATYSQGNKGGFVRGGRRDSENWTKFLDEDLSAYEGQAYSDKNADLAYDRSFQSNSWKRGVPEFHQLSSFDMPVV